MDLIVQLKAFYEKRTLFRMPSYTLYYDYHSIAIVLKRDVCIYLSRQYDISFVTGRIYCFGIIDSFTDSSWHNKALMSRLCGSSIVQIVTFSASAITTNNKGPFTKSNNVLFVTQGTAVCGGCNAGMCVLFFICCHKPGKSSVKHQVKCELYIVEG